MLAKWNGVLSEDKRQEMANLAVYGFVPQWFYTAQVGVADQALGAGRSAPVAVDPAAPSGMRSFCPA